MWKVATYRFDSGAIAISNHALPEDSEEVQTIWVYPAIKPKRGQGYGHDDPKSAEMAQRIADFLNGK